MEKRQVEILAPAGSFDSMKAAVADDLNVNPKSVSGYNLGEHGNSQFTAWSQVKVKGQPG